MKKIACLIGALYPFMSLSSFAAEAPKEAVVDEDAIENTDVYAIPLDRSSDEDEAHMAKMRRIEKKQMQEKKASTMEQKAEK